MSHPVVNRGSADKLFITTAGVGLVPDGNCISASNAKPGDAIIVSGPTGEGRDARIIGEVVESHANMAILKTEIGGSRVLDLPFCRAIAAHLLNPPPGSRKLE